MNLVKATFALLTFLLMGAAVLFTELLTQEADELYGLVILRHCVK